MQGEYSNILNLYFRCPLLLVLEPVLSLMIHQDPLQVISPLLLAYQALLSLTPQLLLQVIKLLLAYQALLSLTPQLFLRVIKLLLAYQALSPLKHQLLL
jgi:hypothetical protein